MLRRSRDRLRPALENRDRGHVATFGEAVVYFTFVFGSAPVSPHAVAERLLAAEIAETVTSPLDGEVRMAPRYRELVRVIRDAQRLAEASRAVTGGHWAGWARKHPLLAAQLAISLLSRKMRSTTRRPADRNEDDEVDSHEDVETKMLRVVDEVNESVAHRQALNAIQHAREREMYQAAYLESEPYLRLTLRRVNFGLSGFSDQDKLAEGQQGDVLLLVHRSGVLQLTIAVRMPQGLNTDQLIPRTIASGVGLRWTEVVEPVMEAASRKGGYDPRRWPGNWLAEIQEGTRWRRIVHADPASLVDLFRLYQDAIVEASGIDPGDEWFCHPLVCVDRLGCCATEVLWTRRHREELNGILLRYEGYRGLRESARLKLPADSSIRDRDSVWHGHASTTLISWDQERKRFDNHLSALLLVENFLLQYWQLRAVNASLEAAGTQPTGTVARDLQRRLIFGLQEFHRSALAYGDAQDTVRALLQSSGAERMRALLGERLAQLGSIVAAERAERSAARSTAAAVAAFAAAVVFGLPAIDQTFTIIKATPDNGVAGWLTEAGAAASFVAYLGVLAALLVALVLYGLPRRRPRPRRIRPAGLEWPGGTIRVVRRDRRDSEKTGEGSALKPTAGGREGQRWPAGSKDDVG
ncbi:hypothetical protein D7223_01945 [Micromonospora endolithica]|uniref:Uncharacterized protein n=1 Tax=Micromonospora endolithica TaxID=230091 RepID=A0A3A9ZQN8_9ACTN|nr:hypothetical protein D7223_01945 [Micromonospora endolithica]